MVLLAMLAVIVTLVLRIRRKNLDDGLLVRMLVLSVVAGWLAARILPAVWSEGFHGLQWRLLLPVHHAGLSLSFFLIVAFPVAVGCLWRQRARVLEYLDAVCPSLLIALVFAKIGCLMAGCCYGAVCSERWGITYPFGSPAYQAQWRERLVEPPACFMHTDRAGNVRLLGHAQAIGVHQDKPPPILIEKARAAGLSIDDFFERLDRARSLPVWPVPAAYIVGALVMWIASECIYRLSARAGCTAAFVVVGYAFMRLVLDGFLGSTARFTAGLSASQLLALPVLLVGVGLAVICARRRSEAQSKRDSVNGDTAPSPRQG
jgi:prolipoprotein diacylglyceryltransferase